MAHSPACGRHRFRSVYVATILLLALALSFAATSSARAASLLFVVNSSGDASDATAGNGTCDTATGDCTLRAAIVEANRNVGPNTIAFNIPGQGVQTIRLGSKLPDLTDGSGPTTIDGYTQPGSSPNTDPRASNAKIMVQVQGGGPDLFDGLTITSPGNLVRGLGFFNLNKSMFLFGAGAHDNRIAGNFIGTNAAATVGATANVSHANGVHISGGASGNVVGGASPADRNVLSGNANHGVGLYNEGTNANVVVGNLVGLNAAGTGRLRNLGHGIDINTGASDNVVGGTASEERNVVSGNVHEGVEISHTTTTLRNRVIGNFIGTDPTGELAPLYARNGQNGVNIEDGVRDAVVEANVIGNSGVNGVAIGGPTTRGHRVSGNWIGVSRGGAPIPNVKAGVQLANGALANRIGPANVIQSNATGVVVKNPATDLNTITRNTVQANNGLGIDLVPAENAVNPNDAGDADTGANEQLNFPVLESATPLEASGTACAGCTVEVFVSDGGAGEHGEGRRFEGSGVVGTDGAFVVPMGRLTVGQYVTATATDSKGNTSEFSRNREVVSGADLDLEAPATVATPSPTPNAAGWNNSNVGVTLDATDQGGSGVASITYSATGAQTVAETTVQGSTARIDVASEGVTSIAYFATDGAGNAEEQKTFTVKIDKTSPRVACGAADGLWHADDVSISCSASDGGSGLASAPDANFSLSTSVPGGTETSNAATATRDVSDVAGNTATASPVAGNKVDKKAPGISITAPPNGAEYQPGEAVPADYGCTDGGSGVGSCSGPVASGENIDTASEGPKSFAVTARDDVGNTATRSHDYTVSSITTYAADAFGRTVVDGWGRADVGGDYAYAHSKADFDANGSFGTVVLPAAGAGRMTTLPGVSARDTDTTFRVRTDKAATANGQMVQCLARIVDGGTRYQGQVRFNANGTVELRAASSVAGKETQLSAGVEVPGLTHSPNSWYRVRVQVTGASPTAIRIKAWADGQAEPRDWQYAVSDSTNALQVPGSVGLRPVLAANSTNAPVLYGIDDLRVSSTG
jgi:CSLREA domain-containing protein